MSIIDPEIDNDTCKHVLRSIAAAKSVPFESVEHPVDAGALLWHGLLVVEFGQFSLSPRGHLVLAIWNYAARMQARAAGQK